jgi:membrane-bound ClpP family serine protease
MHSLLSKLLLAMLCAALVACERSVPVEAPATIIDVPVNTGEGGALSGGVPPPTPRRVDIDVLAGTDWPKATLTSGEASIRCDVEHDLAVEEGSTTVTDLSYTSVMEAVKPCEKPGVVRLRYTGKIGTDFTSLVERVANAANRLEIKRRILDLDSSGGHVEDAMKAGDAIGASHWMLRVRDDAICHSACVLILAAGDDRVITGKVGIHRMIRVGSSATTRAELNQELREVYAKMKDYLERNGASVAVADLMMTVPNRKLRLLTEGELQEYGLDGTNAVQDDLERIRLTRECGEDFVRRKDDFDRAFERSCAKMEEGQGQEAAYQCGLALRAGFGFPDETCPKDSPLSEYDGADASDPIQAGAQ